MERGIPRDRHACNGASEVAPSEVAPTARLSFRAADMIGHLRQFLNIPVDERLEATARRFIWVGLTALAIDALIFETLFELGVGQVSAQTVSFGIASIFGYILNSRTALAGIKRDSSDGAWLKRGPRPHPARYPEAAHRCANAAAKYRGLSATPGRILQLFR
jgi:hypothetical protein